MLRPSVVHVPTGISGLAHAVFKKTGSALIWEVRLKRGHLKNKSSSEFRPHLQPFYCTHLWNIQFSPPPGIRHLWQVSCPYFARILGGFPSEHLSQLYLAVTRVIFYLCFHTCTTNFLSLLPCLFYLPASLSGQSWSLVNISSVMGWMNLWVPAINGWWKPLSRPTVLFLLFILCHLSRGFCSYHFCLPSRVSEAFLKACFQ